MKWVEKRRDPWRADPCMCGHRRDEHKPGKRPRWPLTSTMRGACLKPCMCTGWELDEKALVEALAAKKAETIAQVRAAVPSFRGGAL